uniref:LAGLIDADG endonuclease domain-containing protein n=1 Tax=Uncinula necator TaxID=52586 RepID=A0A7U1BEY7_UNCNE|nr:LAGLIDADG endonuclease domain-containing protein [Erysiphe necator]QQY98181.1 LAGLIDADG endonuclease domain-containing protein [Erysiphe necator]
MTFYHTNNSIKIPESGNYNTRFSQYITGLLEGDGTIHVPKTLRSVKGTLNYPSIQIVFHLKDLPLALIIQRELGHGSLSKKKGANAYIFTVNNSEGLILLINLLNGNMKTNKIEVLHKLIDWYNKYRNTTFEKKGFNTDSLLSNAWLSGFIEADGHFSLRSTESGKYPKIECKFELSKRQKDQNNKDNFFFLNEIAICFESLVKLIRNDSENPQYRVRTTNLKGNLAVVNYLTRYPLFGTKYCDYKDWVKVVQLFKENRLNHKTNMVYVKSIKSGMNDKRTIFVWDHLQNFYSSSRGSYG